MNHESHKLNRSIVELPKLVADKIAAGEVVDRPLSVVKELLENAIDADSTAITVEIKNGGKTYIRVTDNGQGIPKEEAELAFKRHATSKIRESEDLDHIVTLGFRGEALSSIAAVSRVELITKRAQDKTGISIKMAGGILAEKSEIGCPEGTTVIVSDLFYNTPARHKFMKPDNTESTLIIDFVSKMALAYSHIKIRLMNNGNILFSTNGKNDVYTNIQTIYSRQWGEELISFERMQRDTDIHGEEGSSAVQQGSFPFQLGSTGLGGLYHIKGYISKPQNTKTNKKSQIFFVNGRYIHSKVLEQAVAAGYAEKVFEGRYPAAFLFLFVKPELLDVNIHPNKKEVRFADDKLVKEFVTKSIIEALGQKKAISDIQEKNIFAFPKNLGDNKMDASLKPKEMQKEIDVKKLLSTKGKFMSIYDNISNINLKEEKTFSTLSQQKQKTHDNLSLQNDETDRALSLQNEKIYKTLTLGVEETKGEYGTPEINKKTSTMVEETYHIDLSEISIISNIFSTYIIGADKDTLYLVDQHAAHERIFYEQLKKQMVQEDKFPQNIMIPIRKEVSFSLKNHLQNWLVFLRNLGFEIEEFGVKTYIIKGIPHFMELGEAESFFDDFIDNISDDTDFTDQKRMDKIISRACKSSVKAHDVLNQKEMEALMEQLQACENPYSCPHGRPVFVKLTKREIEKMFKRI